MQQSPSIPRNAAVVLALAGTDAWFWLLKVSICFQLCSTHHQGVTQDPRIPEACTQSLNPRALSPKPRTVIFTICMCIIIYYIFYSVLYIYIYILNVMVYSMSRYIYIYIYIYIYVHTHTYIRVIYLARAQDGVLSIWISSLPVPILVWKDLVDENCSWACHGAPTCYPIIMFSKP